MIVVSQLQGNTRKNVKVQQITVVILFHFIILSDMQNEAG